MKKWMAVAMLAACLGLGGSASSASGATAPQMTGHWAGFFHSIANPDIRGELTLDVASQQGTRFSGDVRGLSPTGGTIPVVGTISVSGVMTMHGDVNREAVDFFGTQPGGGDYVAPDFPAWSGQYRITYPGGTHDEGNAVAAHLVPDAGAPSFEGDWSGDGLATPGVDCRLTPSERDENLFDGSFVQDRSGVISGRITLTNDGGSDPQTFDLTGQAFGGNGVSDDGLVLVGSSDRALIVIQLNLPRPPSGPQLKGSYLMLNDAGRPTCETGSITLTSSDSGVGTAP